MLRRREVEIKRFKLGTRAQVELLCSKPTVEDIKRFLQMFSMRQSPTTRSLLLRKMHNAIPPTRSHESVS